MKGEAQTSQIPIFSHDLRTDLFSEVIPDKSSEESKEIEQRLTSIIDEFSKEGNRSEVD